MGNEMEWRPIETAPKNGSTIMIAMSPTGPVWMAHWRTYPEPGMNEWTIDQVVGWTRVGFCDAALEPTHWMPLPPPPQEAESK